MRHLLGWCDTDFNLAYVYARGYHDGRVNGWTDLEWMTPEEVGIYGRGYDKGVLDYNQYDEPKATA